MLQRIVFFLDKQSVEKKIENLLKELADNRIAVEWRERITSKTELPEQEWNKETDTEKGVLYITDSAECQQFLKQSQMPTLVYLHEGNRKEKFIEANYAIEQIEEIEAESLELVYRRLVGKPWDILTTKRCKIRESTLEDVETFYEIYQEPSITYYMENLFEDKAEEAAYMKDYIQNIYAFYGYGIWTILEKDSERIIGRAGISWREGYDIPELGFVIAVPYQGRGYAYEVCQAILEYGRKEFAFSQYQVLVMEGNEKSVHLCRKLGFEEDSYVTMEDKTYLRMMLTIK